MSRARPVLPGAVLFNTRRVHKRQFLLRPSKELSQLLAYIIAVYAERHEILLHALCVMSNHWHNALTDPLGHIVDFERDVHSCIARAVNALHRESESLWAREQSCRVECAAPDDALDKIAYIMANPVSAGLVAHGKNWPGLRLAWGMKPQTIKRPEFFFRSEDEGGSWPDEVTLTLHRPTGFKDLDDDELSAKMRDLVEQREKQARDELRADGKHFIGRRRVLRQSRHAHACSAEPRGTLKPRVAARSKDARLALLRRNAAWLKAYEDAKQRFLAGDRVVRFPYGTWKLRRYYRCLCDPPPVA
jgi:putative transposase